TGHPAPPGQVGLRRGVLGERPPRRVRNPPPGPLASAAWPRLDLGGLATSTRETASWPEASHAGAKAGSPPPTAKRPAPEGLEPYSGRPWARSRRSRGEIAPTAFAVALNRSCIVTA